MKKFALVGLLFVMTWLLAGCGTSVERDPAMDAFAVCLSDNGAIMYGTEWCQHCKNQKAMFGASFDQVEYVDCDQRKHQCLAAGVEGYPTWDVNGTLLVGAQELVALGEAAWCAL